MSAGVPNGLLQSTAQLPTGTLSNCSTNTETELGGRAARRGALESWGNQHKPGLSRVSGQGAGENEDSPLQGASLA